MSVSSMLQIKISLLINHYHCIVSWGIYIYNFFETFNFGPFGLVRDLATLKTLHRFSKVCFVEIKHWSFHPQSHTRYFITKSVRWGYFIKS